VRELHRRCQDDVLPFVAFGAGSKRSEHSFAGGARSDRRVSRSGIATLLLAVLWGVWHLPLYGLGFVGPMLYAFFYTYLYNRTGSVGLCILLHGSFTAALDTLILTTDSATVDVTILATLLAATVLLVGLTRGRLGLAPPPAAVAPTAAPVAAHR
jgi:hypothetical protein